ncbi:hypothetical protein A2U01_0060577, partial [Trifolium medium]|nr:hypothetical protein [Trifolium medium]
MAHPYAGLGYRVLGQGRFRRKMEEKDGSLPSNVQAKIGVESN